MTKKYLVAALAAVSVLALAGSAGAITRGGTLDGDDHPYVGLMVGGSENPDGSFAPAFRCSGALVSPTLYITAGHCTEGVDRAELWFISDLQDGVSGGAPGYGYPFVGQVSGTPTAHDQYIDAAFYLYDLGVVVLDEPFIIGDGTPGDYASLASLGYVDGMTKGRNKDSSKVTAVGYGLQMVIDGNPFDGMDLKVQADKTRWQADLMIVNTQGVAGLGAINPGQAFAMSGDAKHGGTCFGDSGGPILAYGTDIIVAVNSFGLNGNCAGIGGAYRVDQPDDIAFLAPFVAAHG